MIVKEILSEELICMNLNVRNKEEALIQISQMLLDNGVIKNKDEFYHAILEREKLGQTGLGYGLAIPHGKSDTVLRTCIFIAKCSQPIKWESPDNIPVKLIIMFAVRNVDSTSIHLKLLAELAMSLAENKNIESLINANSKKEIITILSSN